jgi:hypothetical protein
MHDASWFRTVYNDIIHHTYSAQYRDLPLLFTVQSTKNCPVLQAKSVYYRNALENFRYGIIILYSTIILHYTGIIDIGQRQTPRTVSSHYICTNMRIIGPWEAN